MTALLLACLVLLQLFSVPSGSAGPRQGERTWCHGSGACYSVHLARLNFTGAKEACAKHGGRLSTAKGKAEVQAIFALLQGVAADASGTSSLFWLGLVRKAQRCTNEDLPLRSFSWDPAELPEASANETMMETPAWLKEPSKSCVRQKCAGLQVSARAPHLQPWGLMESSCNNPSPGYICKYRYDGVCTALLPPPGSGTLGYTLPYRVQSPALEFSPLGTVLTLRCPTREAHFTCRPSPDGYHWASNEQHRLCSCPSGYWSPSKGECVEAADCVGSQGAFLCLCASGSRLAADEESCLQAQSEGSAGAPGSATTPTSGGASLSNSTTSLPGPNSSLEEPFPSGTFNSSGPAVEETLVHPDSSSNYIFILITVAVVMLVILVMAALQSFQVCCKICSSKRSHSNKDVAPAAAAEGDPEASATRTDSEHSLGPSKAESAEVSPEDLKPADRELEQAPGDWEDPLQEKN